MKQSVLILAILSSALNLKAQDINPSANLQTLPSGSYVIAMDQQNQSYGTASFTLVIDNRNFNYTSGNATITAVTNTTGILVGMSVTGQGAIPAGTTVTAVTATTVTLSAAPTGSGTNKALDFGNMIYDADDFNLKAYGLVVYLLNYNVKVKWVMKTGKARNAADFTTTAQMFQPTLGGASSKSFLAAPFVIFAQDTLGVASFIKNYYTEKALTGNFRPRVYKTTVATSNVDIRYDLTGFKPKAAILDDGGNEDIHVDFMIAAGIPNLNYSISDGASLQADCYSFASEPHNDNDGPVVDTAISRIRQFVLAGGNFLAECKAIINYENNPLGRFQTTTGISIVNANLSNNVVFQNPDLSFYQIEGNYDGSNAGSVKNWSVIGSNLPNLSKATGTGANSAVQAATMSKVSSTQRGGLVFYLGNHNFTPGAEEGNNGIRMYMNAFMTPSQAFCQTMPDVPLVVKLTNFSGYLTNNKVTLNWNVAENEMVDQFQVERSVDGENFSTAALVFNTEKNGNENYNYFETMQASKTFYRLRITDKSNVVTYSRILVFETTATVANDLKLLNNPVQDKLNFRYETGANNTVEIKILDMAGRPVFQQKMNTSKGTNMISLPVPATLTKGMYIITLQDGAVQKSAKFVKN